jgi:hypothetical protein
MSKYTCVNEADKDFALFQHKLEIDDLVSFLLQQKQLTNFVEIGSHKGGTFYVLASLIAGKRISIDLCSGQFGGVGQKVAEDRNKRLSDKFDNTYFIEGDSHKYEAVKKLNDILDGEKVSVLMIDGDHTFEGCFNDFLIYRQFVKQDGFIVFHDIKSSVFHAKANCKVDEVWKLIINQCKCYEFVSTGNSDCCSSAKNMVKLGEWGGIGVVCNDDLIKSKDVHILQAFYDQQSLDTCFSILESNEIKYLPELIINTEQVYLENEVILKVYNEYKFKEGDFIGITSPRLSEKTKINRNDGLTVKKLVDQISAEKDVLVYSPDYSFMKIKGLDIWRFNKTHRCDIYTSAEYLNNSGVLPIDIFKNKWYECYCNYWVASKEVFDEYCSTILKPAMNLFKFGQGWKDYEGTSNPKLVHRGKTWRIMPYVLEGLFGSFLANKNYKIKDIYNEKPAENN